MHGASIESWECAATVLAMSLETGISAISMTEI
jgi:hypothetical protein